MNASGRLGNICGLIDYSFVFLPEDDSGTKSDQEAKENAVLQAAIKTRTTGDMRFQEKKFDDAIAMYTEAISKLHGTEDKLCLRELAICYQSRAAAYEQQTLFDKALADATKAIELNELYAKAYFRRAKIYIGQQKYYCAMQDIVQACILTKFKNKWCTRIAADLTARFGRWFSNGY